MCVLSCDSHGKLVATFPGTGAKLLLTAAQVGDAWLAAMLLYEALNTDVAHLFAASGVCTR